MIQCLLEIVNLKGQRNIRSTAGTIVILQLVTDSCSFTHTLIGWACLTDSHAHANGRDTCGPILDSDVRRHRVTE